ncbi:hypothetical protein RCL1_005922 [Eukaryota sp. TZLM3-RCL]
MSNISVAITDAILCLVLTILVVKLYTKHKKSSDRNFVKLSCLFFIASALGAISGTVYHALENKFSDRVLFYLWFPVKYSLALSAYCTAKVVTDSLLTKNCKKFMSTLIYSKTLFYCGFVYNIRSFLPTAIDFGSTIIFAIVLCLAKIKQAPHSVLLLFGWVFALSGVLWQVSKFAISDLFFDHNDAFHTLAAVSSVFVYFGMNKYLRSLDEHLIINEDKV